jgi:hypothetical protein
MTLGTLTRTEKLTSKKCSKCHVEKAYSEFYPKKKFPGKCDVYCKGCRAQWRENNREKCKSASNRWRALNVDRCKKQWKSWSVANPRKFNWGWYIKRRYGLSPEQVETMRLQQDNRCAICKSEFQSKFNIDHDHKTGKVRGLLCPLCNRGLGQLKDSPEILIAAAGYLGLIIE